MGLVQDNHEVQKIVAVAHDKRVSIIGYSLGQEIHFGKFSMPMNVSHVFFVGYELIALSQNHIGVWRSQHWLTFRVAPITSFDVGGGSFLFFGASNGSIYYIDMEKFPLRMKDNDLLVSELFRDPSSPNVAITALSVYLPTKTKGNNGNSIEIAYGCSNGLVRLIVQYPETVGQGPQLYQTFTMHTSPIVDILLNDKSLVSTCAQQHGMLISRNFWKFSQISSQTFLFSLVRTWSVTRFRGMISTYPGSTVLASFTLVDLEHLHSHQGEDCSSNEMTFRPKQRTTAGGPDDESLFIQRMAPNEILLRLASNGERVSDIRSVDDSAIVAFCEHDCDSSTTRSSSGSSNILFTGHDNGVIQMWDLATASVMFKKGSLETKGGLKSQEMAKLIDTCKLLEI